MPYNLSNHLQRTELPEGGVVFTSIYGPSFYKKLLRLQAEKRAELRLEKDAALAEDVNEHLYDRALVGTAFSHFENFVTDDGPLPCRGEGGERIEANFLALLAVEEVRLAIESAITARTNRLTERFQAAEKNSAAP